MVAIPGVARLIELLERLLGTPQGNPEGEPASVSSKDMLRYMNTGIKDASSAMDRMSVTLDSLNVPGLMGGIQKAGVDLAFTFEKLNIGLGQTTGLVPHLTGDFLELTRQTSHLGMSLEETAQVTGELALGLRKFPTLSRNVRLGLARVSAELKQVGVSGRDSSRALDIFTSALRRTPEAAGASMESIHLLAQSVGRSTAQVMSDFNRMAPQLLRYGNSYETVFGKLQKTARAYHMEASEVLRVTDAFDTFEGAAQKVGALNSAFGRYGLQLNDIALMQMDHAERQEYLGEQFRNANVDLQELLPRQRQFLAAQLTGGDQDLLARMLGPKDDYDDYMQAQEALGDTALRFTDSVQTAQGAVQKFTIDSGALAKGAGVLEQIAGSFQRISKAGATMVDYGLDYKSMAGLLKLKTFTDFVSQGNLVVSPDNADQAAKIIEQLNQVKKNRMRPKPANDLFIPGAQQGGKYVVGPEGTFSLNKKDSIMAGTNLGGGLSPKEIQKAVMAGVSEALKGGGQRQPIEISLDGRIIGRAVTDFINQEHNLYHPV